MRSAAGALFQRFQDWPLLKEEFDPERLLLVTPEQEAVLSRLELLDAYGAPRLPRPFVPSWLVIVRLTDYLGIYWQIVPEALTLLFGASDREAAGRA
jgi:hypothetical protein